MMTARLKRATPAAKARRNEGFAPSASSRLPASVDAPPFCQLTPRRDQIHRHVISRAQATAIDLQHARSRPALTRRGAMAG
jgi:hypothetical protein